MILSHDAWKMFKKYEKTCRSKALELDELKSLVDLKFSCYQNLQVATN